MFRTHTTFQSSLENRRGLTRPVSSGLGGRGRDDCDEAAEAHGSTDAPTDRFQKVFGDVREALDVQMPTLTTFGETMLRLSPPGGERIETADQLAFRTAGAESNVAITAARLGQDATWLSKLPSNPLGRRVLTDLQSHGVSPAIAWDDNGRQGTYYIEFGGQPRGTNVIYDRERAAITTATPDELPTEHVERAAAFYTSGITPALSPTLAETTQSLLETARNHGTTTVFDVNYRSKLWTPAEARSALSALLAYVDILVVAERDANTVFGLDGPATSIATELRETHDAEQVIVTRGDDGALSLTDSGYAACEALEAETLDPIGTGDAFVGGYLARHLAGDSVGDALEYAAAVAALKRTIRGDHAVVSPAEVDRVLDASSASISR